MHKQMQSINKCNQANASKQSTTSISNQMQVNKQKQESKCKSKQSIAKYTNAIKQMNQGSTFE
jgi:hypothetical protein